MIAAISSLKVNSEELEQMLHAGASAINDDIGYIGQIVEGSHSGDEAVGALRIAVGALGQAARGMVSLRQTCDDCIKSLRS